MSNKNYEVNDDLGINNAGFENKTPYELERDQILQELSKYSEKTTIGTLLLCACLGVGGVHRYVNGKIGSGLLYTCTAGVFFLGWISDIFKIASGRFTDGKGKIINTPQVVKLRAELNALKAKYAK